MKTTTKILIAEHDVHDVELLLCELKKNHFHFVTEIVDREMAFIQALENFEPDLILCDYTFPAFSGPAAFKIKEQLAPVTPFIFVSGTIGEEQSIELIGSGLTDYVLKDKLFTLNNKVIRALKESIQRRQKIKMEHDLILSERLLARAQQIAHIGNWELNFSNNVLRWSDEACRMHGLAAGKNQQSLESWLSLIHPEDADFTCRQIVQGQHKHGDFSFRYRVLHDNGSMRHIYVESKTDGKSPGLPQGLYGIAQDITERIELEDRLTKERHIKQSEITAAVLSAQETERANIGQELHDDLNQVLGATKFYIELAKTSAENAQELLDKSSVCITSVIDKIRKISKTLTGPGMQVGLFSSIKVLIADLGLVHALDIQFRENNTREKNLHEGLKLTIFRIVQEQVTNILKHSKATKVTIRLNRLDDNVILQISDNGIGMDISSETEGVGIRNIKSRAALCNGTVTIKSSAGKGCILKVVLSTHTYVNKPALPKRIMAY